MNWLAAAAFSLLLVPAVAAAASGGQELDVEILIGRTEVMHDQTARGLSVLGVIRATDDGEQYSPSDVPRDPYRRLTDAVVRFNSLRDLACGTHVIVAPVCAGPRYTPAWVLPTTRPVNRPEDLRRMAEDLQSKTMPLWLAVCDRAKARTGDRNFCAIE